jgi:tetratricopeptide (TPR) repeat protein
MPIIGVTVSNGQRQNNKFTKTINQFPFFTMKKILLVAATLVCGSAFVANAQEALDKFYLEQMAKDKKKSDEDLGNEKAKAKPSFWLARATTYGEVAQRNMKLDSNAAFVAYEAYNKAIELDTKDGKEGKIAKEARQALDKPELVFRSFMIKGDAHYKSKNYAEAARAMQMAAKIDTKKDTLVHLFLGVIGQQMGDTEMTQKGWEMMVANGAKEPSAFYQLAQIYRKKAVDNKDKAMEDKAIETIQDGIKRNPTNKDLQNEKINLFFAFNRLDAAIEELKASIAADPKNSTNLLNLAILNDNAANEMKRQMRKLSESMSHGSDVKAKLEKQNEKLSVYQDELRRISDQLKKQPKNNDLKRRQQETQQMVSETQAEVSKLNTEMAAEAAKAGEVANSKKQYDELNVQYTAKKDEARKYYSLALQADPENYDAIFNMGVQIFNDAVDMKQRVDGMDMATYNKEGKVIEEQYLAKFKEALPHFEKAYSIKKDPDCKSNLQTLYRLLKMSAELEKLGD